MAERKMVKLVQSLKNKKKFESALTPPHKRKILCFTKGATFSNSQDEIKGKNKEKKIICFAFVYLVEDLPFQES